MPVDAIIRQIWENAVASRSDLDYRVPVPTKAAATSLRSHLHSYRRKVAMAIYGPLKYKEHKYYEFTVKFDETHGYAVLFQRWTLEVPPPAGVDPADYNPLALYESTEPEPELETEPEPPSMPTEPEEQEEVQPRDPPVGFFVIFHAELGVLDSFKGGKPRFSLTKPYEKCLWFATHKQAEYTLDELPEWAAKRCTIIGSPPTGA